MIKTILFDMGGVVITLDQKQAIKRFKALGLHDAEQRLDAYTQQGIFGDLEAGKISDEDFRRELGLLVGRELTWDECRHAWMGYCGGVPQRNLDKMAELRKRGYRVVLLSNTNPYMMSWVMSDEFDGKGHSLAHYLDEAYMSYKCGAMKPDPIFFNAVIKGEKLVPEETLFIDDGPRNIEAAKALGIQTLLVNNGEDWTNIIEEKLSI
ncbi:MAG: HAD family phosphatase [Prevotella sp.]|nr:HAD family phosphatase [Prevotella sp.]MDD5896376.1 HAD family phosphatase [Prevotellaceae bacterium]